MHIAREIIHFSYTGFPEDLTRIADSPTIPLSLEAKSHHLKLMLKYEYVSRYPWLPVLPDPPEPK